MGLKQGRVCTVRGGLGIDFIDMKYPLFLLLLPLFAFGQSHSSKKFVGESGSFIEFLDKGTIRFCIVRTGGLGESTICGCGKIKAKGNIYVMNRTNSDCDFSGISRSEFSLIETNVSGLQIEVTDNNGKAVIGVNISQKDKHGKFGEAVILKKESIVRRSDIPSDSILYVSSLGFHPIRIKLIRFTNQAIKVVLFPGSLDLIEDTKYRIKLSLSDGKLLLYHDNISEILIEKD